MKEIARAIAEGFKFLGQVYKDSYNRRIRKAFDGAREYIFVNEKDGKYEDFSDKKRKHLLKKYREQFFDNN